MSTEGIIPDKVTQVWNDWETRGLVLLSLWLQILLTGFGSRRKYVANVWTRLLVWSAYLLADMVATFALGNISSAQGDDSSPGSNTIIQSVWASFLLLHLGGPDTITSYSTEDNELWLRHLFDLGTQGIAAFYIFVRIWGKATVQFPAIPIFTTAFIKCGERVWVQRRSCAENIKDSLVLASPTQEGKNIQKVVPRESPPPPAMKNYVHQGYYLFNISMYLFQGISLGTTELKDSFSIISSLPSAKDALKIVEVELGFMFDVLYTKAPLVYSTFGICLRTISFLSSVVALLLYTFIVSNKHIYPTADVDISYVLVVGFLSLEVYALTYHLFSDWTMVWWSKQENLQPESFLKYLINGKRWSGFMAQYNLISSCCKIKSSSKSIVNLAKSIGVNELLGIEEMMKHFQVTWKHMDDTMRDLISTELLAKGQVIMHNLEDHTRVAKNFMSQRGDGVLGKISEYYDFERTNLEIEFHHSLLIWHVATDLCYHRDVDEHYSFSETSKSLSDYMMYLLVVKPGMIPQGVGDMKSRIQETREEVRKFLEKCNKISSTEKEVSLELLKWNTGDITGGERSKSVLIVACELAKELLTYDSRNKWVLIAKVWVEMVAYAACHCSWKEHILQLRRGGELLTHVCVLMAHVGLSQQYHETKGATEDSLEKKWDALSEEMMNMTNILMGSERTTHMPRERIDLLRDIRVLLENDNALRRSAVSDSD